MQIICKTRGLCDQRKMSHSNTSNIRLRCNSFLALSIFLKCNPLPSCLRPNTSKPSRISCSVFLSSFEIKHETFFKDSQILEIIFTYEIITRFLKIITRCQMILLSIGKWKNNDFQIQNILIESTFSSLIMVL